jgi:ATP-dependent helicase IRC3
MKLQKDKQFCLKYDLQKEREKKNDLHQERKKKGADITAGFQLEAINKLKNWYNSHPRPYAGGILVLPTGGGKTFTALRFLATTALSEGYKVLWLAHTHHLLEQAFSSFSKHVGWISEPRDSLKIRVVSGTIGHFHTPHIEPQDDVIVATLQTITKAYKENHPALNAFLDSAGSKLFVVFDEAHHAPAPTYRDLILNLRDRFKDMYLLGLTATPVYTDETLQGWINELFPQGIPYQVSASKLMAEGVLAKPILEQQNTKISPNFELREYEKWVGAFRDDIPEKIITQLAENKNRNMFIANHYWKNRSKYGKTIIFADRWFQCEAIADNLISLGMDKDRVGSIYSHIDAKLRSVEARNCRKSDENSEVLDKFRNNDLDVVINVRMLTEGTDIPDVQTCFITRQTTSQILLTQMVGRALRGPEFGGTPEANLVFFTDNWEQLINWAEYDPNIDGGIDEKATDPRKRPPIQYISIELVRKLVAQMNSGINIMPDEYVKTLLPEGWYSVEYFAKDIDSEEVGYVRRLVMVFEHESASYKRLIEELTTNCTAELEKIKDQDVQFENVTDYISDLGQEFFSDANQHFGSNLPQDIFSITRHVAQSGKEPKFFQFEERSNHDLDKIAQEILDQRIDPYLEDDEVRLEFNRKDRYWQVLYITFDLFKSQYLACRERIIRAGRHGDNPKNHVINSITYYPPQTQEPSLELKIQIKERDGCCLSCGNKKMRHLQVDHILPLHFGGTHIFDNLQTLCSPCNLAKNVDRINFLDPQTDLSAPPKMLPNFEPPSGNDAIDSDLWEQYLRKTINFFYRCAAVHRVTIGQRGENFYTWRVELKAGNDPRWLELHLGELLDRVRTAKGNAGYSFPKSIRVSAPGFSEVEGL